MTGTIRLAICAALTLVFAGCSALEPYPRVITDIGESADYPPSAAGFERQAVINHATGGRDFSVYYALCAAADEQIDIGAVLRMTRITGPGDTVQARVEAEKRFLEKLATPPEQLNEPTLTLTKGGQAYAALKLSYLGRGYSYCRTAERSDILYVFEPPVPRYVELFVWRHEDRILTLHSIAAPENQDIASAKNLELLDAVNWTVLPF